MDHLDVRDPEVLLWLPCIWLSKILEAHSAFLERLIIDSTDPEEPEPHEVVFSAERREGWRLIDGPLLQ